MEKLTTACAIPYFHQEDSLTAGPRVSVLLEDFIQPYPAHIHSAQQLESNLVEWYDRNTKGEDDHYSQPDELFRAVMNDSERQRLVETITAAMSQFSRPKRQELIGRQPSLFFRADAGLGNALAMVYK